MFVTSRFVEVPEGFSGEIFGWEVVGGVDLSYDGSRHPFQLNDNMCCYEYRWDGRFCLLFVVMQNQASCYHIELAC